MSYKNVWNLDNIFLGGSKSKQFLDYISQLHTRVNDLERNIKIFNTPQSTFEVDKLVHFAEFIGDIQMNLSQAHSFTTCLLAENPGDQQAIILKEKVAQLESLFENQLSKVKKLLADTKQEVWESIVETKKIAKFRFILNEWRENVDKHLSEEVQNIISSLTVDGYHAWGQFYHDLMSNIYVDIQIEEEKKNLSVGQAINLRSHSSEEVRKESHYALETIWEEKEELFAKIFNHIGGFRIQMYNHRGITDVLTESLKMNRIKEETLNTMWSVIIKYKQPFINYLKRKAEIMGDSSMKAYNFWAPLTKSNQEIKYDEAVDFITQCFSQFGTELEGFANQAFKKGWIEAQDHPNKSAVAFCAGFPHTNESRVFMTFGGTFKSLLTLAHELGHGFHNYAMKNVNELNKSYPMCIAETASTFSEMIILDAAMEKAESKEERIFLLDQKLKRSVMNFMNIHSRFLFEQKFYEERRKGYVSSARLNDLMEEAIDKGYNGSLDQISVHSWVWTPHYYITQTPFYNFPYTFGYLFALGIYVKAKERGKDFEKDYLNLLRDSGSSTTEDLVMKHLGEDITSEEFWEKAMSLCIKDADEFIKLTSY